MGTCALTEYTISELWIAAPHIAACMPAALLMSMWKHWLCVLNYPNWESQRSRVYESPFNTLKMSMTKF